jgi:hypothetical protein
MACVLVQACSRPADGWDSGNAQSVDCRADTANCCKSPCRSCIPHSAFPEQVPHGVPRAGDMGRGRCILQAEWQPSGCAGQQRGAGHCTPGTADHTALTDSNQVGSLQQLRDRCLMMSCSSCLTYALLAKSMHSLQHTCMQVAELQLLLQAIAVRSACHCRLSCLSLQPELQLSS